MSVVDLISLSLAVFLSGFLIGILVGYHRKDNEL